jgi:transposase
MRNTTKIPGANIVKDIKRTTRKLYSSEEKIRIVLDGLCGQNRIADLCRREGIFQGIYYKWSINFMEAGNQRLAGDTTRWANTDEVKELWRKARDLKRVAAEQTLELRLLKKHVRPLGRLRMRYPAITKLPTLAENCCHLFADLRIIWWFVAPDSLGIETNKPARSALQGIMNPHGLTCCCPWHIRCCQFFLSRFFRTTLSNMVSAKRRFSLAVLSSSDLKWWASETSTPRYLALNL